MYAPQLRRAETASPANTPTAGKQLIDEIIWHTIRKHL
jgi:hypothetical protein